MSLFHSVLATESVYSITFFCEFNQAELESKLVPIGFKVKKNELLFAFEGDSKKMSIRPFQHNGSDNFGYILSYSDSYEDLASILKYAFALIPIQIVNCELKIVNGNSQLENVGVAEGITGFKKGSMYGIYDTSNMGVLCMYDGSIICQQRMNNPKVEKMKSHLFVFNQVADNFRTNRLDLFEGILNF